jgi:hypothetical protein
MADEAKFSNCGRAIGTLALLLLSLQSGGSAFQVLYRFKPVREQPPNKGPDPRSGIPIALE